VNINNNFGRTTHAFVLPSLRGR